MTSWEKRQALAQLLDKETKLLQTIDRLKAAACKENKEKHIHDMLEMMTKPKEWRTSTGDIAEIHTPYTTRAAELMELYNGKLSFACLSCNNILITKNKKIYIVLQSALIIVKGVVQMFFQTSILTSFCCEYGKTGLRLPLLTIDERLDLLLHVKWTVKEFDCNLTREIVELVDREADMLNRGRSEKSLEGLRKRLANLFLQFIETPEFNPESARFQRVPEEYAVRPNIKLLS